MSKFLSIICSKREALVWSKSQIFNFLRYILIMNEELEFTENQRLPLRTFLHRPKYIMDYFETIKLKALISRKSQFFNHNRYSIGAAFDCQWILYSQLGSLMEEKETRIDKKSQNAGKSQRSYSGHHAAFVEEAGSFFTWSLAVLLQQGQRCRSLGSLRESIRARRDGENKRRLSGVVVFSGWESPLLGLAPV